MYQDLQNYSNKDTNGFTEYKGLKIFSSPNIHETIFNDFISKNPNKDSSILILGSGSGAFDQRLLDNGYNNITSIDFIKDSYKIKGTTFINMDLNTENWNLGKFDFIFAIEVIEHLENQFSFVKNIKECNNENGIIYITSPNIESKMSRISFLLNGFLSYFKEYDLKKIGHINPIIGHIFRYILDKNGLQIEKILTNNNSGVNLSMIKSFRSFIGYTIYKIIGFFIPGNNNDINIYIIKIK